MFFTGVFGLLALAGIIILVKKSHKEQVDEAISKIKDLDCKKAKIIVKTEVGKEIKSKYGNENGVNIRDYSGKWALPLDYRTVTIVAIER